MHSFYLMVALVATVFGIDFVPYKPGLIPDLTKDLTGGYQVIDLNKGSNRHDIEIMINDNLLKLNARHPVVVKLVKLQQATEQKFNGWHYKVVFLAEEENLFSAIPHVTIGECYFEMYAKPEEDQKTNADVTKYICAKLPY